MDYTLVFDASTRLPPAPAFIPAMFTLIGVVMLAGAGRGLPPGPFPLKAYLFPGVWTLFSLFASSALLTGFLRENGDGCRALEGTVDNYVARQKDESFSVAGEAFTYSDFQLTRAFNNMASQGGPIRAGQHVRVCAKDHKIWRLEIAEATSSPAKVDPFLIVPLSLPVMFPLVMAIMSFMSGWRALATRYPRKRDPMGQGFAAQSLQISLLGSYRGIMNIALSDDALWITPVTLFAAFHPPVEIPRDQILRVEPSSTFGIASTALTLTSGETVKLMGAAAKALSR